MYIKNYVPISECFVVIVAGISRHVQMLLFEFEFQTTHVNITPH